MEEQIIKAVFNRKAIWDPTDESRRNPRTLKALWEDIAVELCIDVKVAKSKWKNLRAYFIYQHRELGKPKPGSGGGMKTVCTWAFYHQMLFLKDISMPLDDSREDGLTPSKTSEFCNETYEDFDTKDFLDTSDSIYSSELADKSIVSTSHRSHEDVEKKNPNKRKFNARVEGLTENTSSEMLELERRKVDLLEREIGTEENPDLLFFKSLLPHMQDFTTTQKLRIQIKIQNIILAEHEAMQKVHLNKEE